MQILALDTSLDACSVALLQDEKITEKHQIAPKKQTQLILPLLEQLLQENNLKLEQLDALAFCHGPASFTGIRIAAGIIQGLALATNLPVITLSSMQAMAQGAYRQFGAEKVLACLDARMQEVYWGVYQLGAHNLMTAVIPDTLCPPQQIIIPESENWLGIGHGWSVYPEILQHACGKNLFQIEANFNPHAQDIALLAKYYYEQGKAVAKEQALPLYLRGAGNWKKIAEQHS